jgi:hypothetical protein
MATAKKGKRSTAPKKSAATNHKARSAPRASAGPSVADVRAQVEALDRRELPEKIRFSVSKVLFHSKRLHKNAVRLRPALLERSRLDPAVIDSLGHCVTVLEECESDWDTKRRRGSPKSLNDARTSATKLRSEAVGALRHFHASDNDLQVRLDEIMEGDGDDDLVDDCKKLGALVDAHWSSLDGRTDLPAERGDAFRKEAALIESNSTALTPEARAAMELRDKAYFHLLAAEREIRECGRFAFRKRPDLAEVFADVLGSKKGGGGGGGGAPGGGGGGPPAK